MPVPYVLVLDRVMSPLPAETLARVAGPVCGLKLATTDASVTAMVRVSVSLETPSSTRS
jgi:hypothetical protein